MFEIADIVKALLQLSDLSVAEFERACVARAWAISKPMQGLVEAAASYPVILDTIIAPPLVLCPFWSVEDYPRAQWRERLRASFEQALREVVADFREPDDRGEWGRGAWAFAGWLGGAVVVSVEETNYEDARVPFLVLACSSRDSEKQIPGGLTARCFSGLDDAD
ncbi:MAG TPA: hypothetical protein VJN18_04670 [Polyangiaceae bacterium]|nr:hypothetical protein [Polyangiaceae bacterium]